MRRCAIAPNTPSAMNSTVTAFAQPPAPRAARGSAPPASPRTPGNSRAAATRAHSAARARTTVDAPADHLPEPPAMCADRCSLSAGSCRARQQDDAHAENAQSDTSAERLTPRPALFEPRDRRHARRTSRRPLPRSARLARPTPAAITNTAPSIAATSHRHPPSSRYAASTIAAGAATSALKWIGTASAIAYAVSAAHRASRVAPARSAASSIAHREQQRRRVRLRLRRARPHGAHPARADRRRRTPSPRSS